MLWCHLNPHFTWRHLCCNHRDEIAQESLHKLHLYGKTWGSFYSDRPVELCPHFKHTALENTENKATAPRREMAKNTNPRALPQLSSTYFAFVGWQRYPALDGAFWNPQEVTSVFSWNYWHSQRAGGELLSKCSRDAAQGLSKEAVRLHQQLKRVFRRAWQIAVWWHYCYFLTYKLAWSNNKGPEQHKNSTEICLRNHGALKSFFVFVGKK